MAAVVRGSGDDAARSRLRSGFDTGDADLLATFDRLSQGHLKVFAGTQIRSICIGHVEPCRRSRCRAAGLFLLPELGLPGKALNEQRLMQME